MTNAEGHAPQSAGAVQLLWLHAALEKGGKAGCKFYENDLPHNWLPTFTGGVIGVGVDPATTEKETSNPFAVCITEQTPAGENIARMIFRFRSADPAKCRAFLREIVTEVKPNAVAIDATNERFWCAEVAEECERAFNGVLRKNKIHGRGDERQDVPRQPRRERI